MPSVTREEEVSLLSLRGSGQALEALVRCSRSPTILPSVLSTCNLSCATRRPGVKNQSPDGLTYFFKLEWRAGRQP